MNEPTASTLDWTAIEHTLPDGWQELAAERHLVRTDLPAHLGSKVKTIGEILRLVFYQVASNTGLEVTTAVFAAAGILSISYVALHKWMKKLGPYLRELLAQMVATEHAVFAPERWAGYEIVVCDATTVMRPGAKGTTARVHRALRLTDLRVLEVHVTDEHVGETLRNFHPRAGQLWIVDRGYAGPPGIAWIAKQKAAVMVRHNRGALPLYDREGRDLGVSEKLKSLRVDQPREWKCWVHPEGGPRIEGRLCAVRLPADKAEEARARVRREQGSDATAETLATAAFVVVFVTVPRNLLSCAQVLDLYRARWQIELDFKRDKSITGLDRLPNFRPDTIESWICAKLLLHQILRKLASTSSTPSAIGAFPPCAVIDACLDQQRRAA